MKNKITVPIIFFFIIICAFPFALNVNRMPSSLPTTVLSIACTILLASLVLPSLLGISESKIVKGLFFILYNNFRHILFPIYHLMLAVAALRAECSEVGSITQTIFSRLLPVLIILDLFYLLYYLRLLLGMIGSPVEMLKVFEKLILKKIRQKMKKGRKEKIFKEIEMLVKISKDAGKGDEKSAALKIFEELLTEVFKLYPKETNIIPTELQYRLWKSLVENVYEVCYNDDDLYSANDSNLSEAIDILNKTWQLIDHWSKTDFDYAVCPRTLKKLAGFAITRGYDNSVDKAVAALGEIGEQCIADQPTPRTPPFEIASDLAEMGIFAVKVGKDGLTDQFIIYLLNFYVISREEKYLFYTLKLMSFIWDDNRDALEDLGAKLSAINKTEIDEAVKYGSICFKREIVRIRRFLDAWDEFKKKDG